MPFCCDTYWGHHLSDGKMGSFERGELSGSILPTHPLIAAISRRRKKGTQEGSSSALIRPFVSLLIELEYLEDAL